MEVTSTIVISGEEREIADAVARGNINSLNNNLSQLEIDLKMLGYTVPKEMPIKNYVDSDGAFHQRVGRVCLYDCDYHIAGEASNSFYTSLEVNNLRLNGELYCNKYKTVSYSDFIDNDKIICVKQYLFIIRDTSCSDITSFKNANKGVYLYYELAEEKTISVDGNEAVTKVNDSLSVIGKCKNLLNPYDDSIERDGINITKNEDGTYTANGTATADILHEIYTLNIAKNIGKTLKLVGCPKGGSHFTYNMVASDNQNVASTLYDFGNGGTKKISQWGATNWWKIYISIKNGVTVSNLVFKPMLVDYEKTPNATYDDFTPYCGDNSTLTEEVAGLKSDLDAFIVSDLNNAERTGFYSFNSGASNIPELNTAGNLQVINGVNFIHQIAYSGNAKIYMRRKDKSNDTWNDWKSTTLS